MATGKICRNWGSVGNLWFCHWLQRLWEFLSLDFWPSGSWASDRRFSSHVTPLGILKAFILRLSANFCGHFAILRTVGDGTLRVWIETRPLCFIFKAWTRNDIKSSPARSEKEGAQVKTSLSLLADLPNWVIRAQSSRLELLTELAKQLHRTMEEEEGLFLKFQYEKSSLVFILVYCIHIRSPFFRFFRFRAMLSIYIH